LKVTPHNLAFGKVLFGTSGATSKPRVVTVTNPSNQKAPVTFESVEPDSDFHLDATATTCSTTLAAGKSCKIAVTFTPSALGDRTGALMIEDNASNSPQMVTLSGVGAAGALKISRHSIGFGKVAIDATASNDSLVLSNPNDVGLDITAITSSDSEFVAGQSCVGVLAAGAQCAINVDFTPNSSGAHHAKLSISDDAQHSPQTITLSGSGN